MSTANQNTLTKYACYCCRMSGCDGGCACSDDSKAATDRQRQRAAAPDLLAALEQIMMFGGGCCCPQAGSTPNLHSQTCREARAAIAKARGQNGA